QPPSAGPAAPTPTATPRLAPLVDGHEALVARALVDQARAHEAVVGVLLVEVRHPAGDARDREDGRVHVGGEAQHAVDGGAEEVDVRPDLLAALLQLALHHALHLQAHLEPLAVARLLGQPAADLLEDLGARAEDPADAVPEAHHAAAGPRQDALDVRLDALDAPDLLEGLHHGLVGTAVQRALERAGGGRDRAVDVGEGAGGGAGDEGAGVRAVLGVEDEGDVHHVRRGLRGLLAGE